MTYLAAVIIFLTSQEIGRSMCTILRISRTRAETIFIGISTSILLCGIFYIVDLDRQVKLNSLLTIFAILIGDSIQRRLRKKSQVNYKTEVKILALLMIAVASYNLVYSGDLSANSIRQRVGPDLLGWIASSQYIESNFSSESLDNWLQETFPENRTINPFGKNQLHTTDSIYYTDQFTRQIQAEFLIGSSRIGLTSFFGVLLNVFPDEISWKHIYLALSSIFQFILILLMFERWPKKSKWDFYSALVLSSTFAVLFPVFEGSFGQHLAIVSFLFILNSFKNRRLLDLIIVIAALIISYIDFIFFTTPIIFASLITSEKFQSMARMKKAPLKTKVLIFLGIFAMIVIANPTKRLESLSFGGWSEGFTPSIMEAFGIGGFYTWSGPRSNTDAYALITFITTILLSLLAKRFFDKTKLFSLGIILVFYTFLFILAWKYNNDYIIWKSLPFFSIFIAVSLQELRLSAAERVRVFKPLLFAQLASAVIFIFAWQGHSQTIAIYNIPKTENQKLSSIVNHYALDFRGITYINTYSLLGDMSWGMSNRQVKDQPAKKTDRKIVTVIPASICEASSDKTPILFLNNEICVVNYSSSMDS